MGDYSEDESSYDASQGSDLDETDQAWSNEEEGCDGSCSDDNYSMSEYGDDPDEAYPEPEPPDYSYEDTSHQGEYEGETEPNISFNEEDEFPGDNTERDDQEIEQEDSWEEESGTEISLEEACEHEEESYAEERPWCDYSDREDEPDSFITNSENEEDAISEAGRNVKESKLVLDEEEEVESEAGRNVDEFEAHSTYFSGFGQRDETYLKWEDEMETLFQRHQFQEEKKLPYATKTLTGPALAWWEKEQFAQWYYKEPDLTWESFKSVFLEDFVKQEPDPSPKCATHVVYAPSNPKNFKAGSKQVNHHHSPQKMKPAVEKKTFKRQVGLQPSSLQCTKVPGTFSYSKGNLGSERKKAGFVLESRKPQDESKAQSLQKPPAPTNPSIRQEDGQPNNAERLKESHGQHLTCPQNVEEVARTIQSTHAANEQIILQLPETIWVNLNLNSLIYNFSNPDIMHLFPGKSFEFISGIEVTDHMDDQHKEITRCLDAKVKQEVTTNNFLIPDDPQGLAPPTKRPDHSRGVFLSFLLKGEPQDVPSKSKPIRYQGKALESQKRMKPNLLYLGDLGADYPVSRSKLFQGRGYDVGIKSVPEPEANQLHHSANQRTNQDMCSVKTAYLTDSEEFHHETNFHGFYTQVGSNPNWNQPKTIPDQKDMNFINRRFLSPSICEGPSLEAVSSPMKKHSDPNQFMDFKVDLLAFQQLKNEEKSPWNYGVMAHFPKPVKPVLHLPYLESHRFNQSQTKLWRPGETSNHSGDQYKHPGESDTFLQCTSIHQIVQNQPRPYLPFLESKAINSQQLFSHQDWHDFYQYFCSKDVPKKLTYSLKPTRYKAIISALESSHLNQEILQQLVFFMFDFLSFVLLF
ncbi:uncharacterized protein LOC130501138 [Raphanus sativus]|uniref:Uncharacterized protein LOC130501138 n=1 Tax=Raphanus sativus TaxID=3726 RepID=A0A9W3CKA9_RAPSA|nr:uncharacterized protein LOC130501138 [Raphanus sativus]